MQHKPTGYLSRKKRNNITYIYLRRSYRENGKIKHQYIYAFGKMPIALDNLYAITNNEQPFPLELEQAGFDISNVMDWIMTLETQITPYGRAFPL